MSNLQLEIQPIGDGFSLKSRIYESLKAAIMDTNIYDGDAELRLDERKLSEQFGISRTPLREALARLDQEGLVRIVPRRGIYIVRKSKAEILEMITVWAALEGMAARLVTLNASNEEISSLRTLCSTFDGEAVKARIDEYSDTNIRFHQVILKMSKCDLLNDLAQSLFMHVRAIRARTISEKDRADKSIVDHMHIIEALEERDTELAERLVREHTLNLKAHVERYVEMD
ncbi:MAG TPA: GntR family transcriptional regulator [Rhizobiales bacterium]|nr:putative HTH-type transcriptional regulator YdfH [bacterium BMS3Bbin10]HDO52342.1 GntR family transcriptional regulator [Hyphomicrobiales bacterium]